MYAKHKLLIVCARPSIVVTVRTMHSLTDSVWIRSKQHVWEAVRVLHREEDSIIVQTADNNQADYKPSDVLPVDPSHLEDLDDLCAVNNLHEAPLLDILRRRFGRDLIYTDIGRVLISINPYRHIGGMYDNPLRYLTTDDPFEDNLSFKGPHIFKLADDALRLFFDLSHLSRSANQSIIVSGESGAGKTEAAKLVMHFLILANNKMNERSRVINKDGKSSDVLLGEHLKGVLEESNVILEAFGNAKTIRNDNSSRFGKYIKLQYSCDNSLSSAFTKVFLLEKSRLVLVNTGERNYHVFYQLLRASLSGADEPTLDINKLCLTDVNAFDILTQGDCTTLSSEAEDGDNFAALCKALREVGCTDEELTALWELLACILHLGNAKVSDPEELRVSPPDPTPTKGESVELAGGLPLPPPISRKEPRCSIEFESMPLEMICTLLGVSPEIFIERLGTRMIKADNRNSIKISVLNSTEVKNNIYSLMKYLYGNLFTWLVQKINYAHGKLAQELKSPFSVAATAQALSSFSSTGSFTDDANDANDGTDSKFIGILDIFGFEILQRNSFEQLCINFANEKLQQQFNESIFVNEQMEYQAEGIPVPEIVYLNNQDVIDLFAKRPNGIFILLEEFSLLNRKMDANNIVSNFNRCHEGHNSAYGINKFDKTDFVIHHFAGDVAYSATDLLKKNNDALQEDLKLFVSMSTCDFLNCLMHLGDLDMGAHLHDYALSSVGARSSNLLHAESNMSATGGGGGRKIAAISTVSFFFRNQLEELMKTLRATQPHYIKCVKPNSSKASGTFDSPLAMQQLLYSGVLDVVRIRRQGYPIQSPFKSFHKALHLLLYGSVLYKVDPEACSVDQSKNLCIEIVSKYLSDDTYAVGKHKIFLKEAAPDILTAALMQRRHKMAKNIQTSWRYHIAHWKYVLLRRSVVKVQELYLTYFHRRRFVKCVAGITYVKAWWKRQKAQRAYAHFRRNIILLQSVMRMKCALLFRIRLFESRAASKLTRWIKYINSRYALRSVLINFRKSVIVLQSIARMAKPKKILQIKKEVLLTRAQRQLATLSKKQFVAAKKIQIFWRLRKQGLPMTEPLKALVVKSLIQTYVNNLRRRLEASKK